MFVLVFVILHFLFKCAYMNTSMGHYLWGKNNQTSSHKSSTGRKCFSLSGTNIWNSLATEAKQASSLDALKNQS